MTMTMEGVEYLSVAAVAEGLATTEMKVLMLLRQKSLSGRYVDGSWYVTAESVAEYRPGEVPDVIQPHCRTTCNASGCGCR